MDSPIVWERSPAMNVRSTGKHRSRSPSTSTSATETPRNDDLLSVPTLARTSTDDLCSTDAALIVALTSLSRGTSEMKTPVQEVLTPYTKSSLTDDLTLPDLLRVTSASDILTQRLQCTASMDELPLLTPNLGKFPSNISTCSDIIKPEPIRLSDMMNQTIPEIQVIDPSIAPLDMGRIESISGDATAITAENVTHANDEQNGDDEIARAAELIRAASETTNEEEIPPLEDDAEQDVDKLESSARPHYHRSSLTVLPMVRTASNPDALPDEMNALASEENDVRAEQRVQEMLDQPDLLRNSTGNSINEEKRGIVSIDHLDSQLSLLHQHLDNDTHKRRHYDPLIHVAIKRARLDESMSGYGKSGFKPVIRTNTSHFTSLIPSSSSILSPTSLIPSSIISPTHTLIPSTSIISPTHTLIPSFTRSLHTLSPRLPTATNLTSLITASHANAQRGASTSFASFSSTISATPSQSAPVSTSSSPPPPVTVARPVPKRRTKKPISPKSETDSHSSTSTSPTPHSPRSISSRDAVIAQSSHAEGDYECKECGKKFTTQSRMLIHYRTHGVGAKPFACEHCGQQFNHKGSLTRHIRTHGGEKPYECTICHKRFFQTGNLTVHFRTHTGEKPFECSECGKRFNHRSSLTVHFRGHF